MSEFSLYPVNFSGLHKGPCIVLDRGIISLDNLCTAVENYPAWVRSVASAEPVLAEPISNILSMISATAAASAASVLPQFRQLPQYKVQYKVLISLNLCPMISNESISSGKCTSTEKKCPVPIPNKSPLSRKQKKLQYEQW